MGHARWEICDGDELGRHLVRVPVIGAVGSREFGLKVWIDDPFAIFSVTHLPVVSPVFPLEHFALRSGRWWEPHTGRAESTLLVSIPAGIAATVRKRVIHTAAAAAESRDSAVVAAAAVAASRVRACVDTVTG